MIIQHSNYKPKVEKGKSHETLRLKSCHSLSNERINHEKIGMKKTAKTVKQLLNFHFLKNNQTAALNNTIPHIHTIHIILPYELPAHEIYISTL